MNYIPERIYVKLSPETAIKLRMIAMNQYADPRQVASQLLSEKVDEKAEVFNKLVTVGDLDIEAGTEREK